MRPTRGAVGALKASQLSWRTTTAIRVFGLAIATGSLLRTESVQASAPLLAVLGLVLVSSAFLERVVHPAHLMWLTVGEAVLVAMLLGTMPGHPGLQAYLAVPPVIAGVRHGLVSVVNVSITAGLVAAATVALSPVPDAEERLAAGISWLVVGLGVGLLAGWQSRSLRDLTTRQAPYAAAHELMSQLHAMTRRGVVGLDSAWVAAELGTAMRESTGAFRLAVLTRGRSDVVEVLASFGDVAGLVDHVAAPVAQRPETVTVIPLRGADHTLSGVVVERPGPWTEELRTRALRIADEFSLRLDTAVLFDEVRVLATAEERSRIARDMHDGVAQEIAGLGYLVDEIESVSDQDETRELAASLRAEITRLVSEIRFSIFDLRHQVTDGRLSGSLAEYVREVSHATGLRVHLSLAESGPPLPPRTAAEVLRVAQEAIGNVRKHARARNLWVSLTSDGSLLRLDVSDDGVGNAEPKDRHWGLHTMRERADGVGAHLEVNPRPDGGTVVTLRSRTTAPHERKAPHEHHRAARR